MIARSGVSVIPDEDLSERRSLAVKAPFARFSLLIHGLFLPKAGISR
jgi:hypothetical protein